MVVVTGVCAWTPGAGRSFPHFLQLCSSTWCCFGNGLPSAFYFPLLKHSPVGLPAGILFGQLLPAQWRGRAVLMTGMFCFTTRCWQSVLAREAAPELQIPWQANALSAGNAVGVAASSVEPALPLTARLVAVCLVL